MKERLHGMMLLNLEVRKQISRYYVLYCGVCVCVCEVGIHWHEFAFILSVNLIYCTAI